MVYACRIPTLHVKSSRRAPEDPTDSWRCGTAYNRNSLEGALIYAAESFAYCYGTTFEAAYEMLRKDGMAGIADHLYENGFDGGRRGAYEEIRSRMELRRDALPLVHQPKRLLESSPTRMLDRRPRQSYTGILHDRTARLGDRAGRMNGSERGPPK